jgi:hypothetical protein
MNQVVNTPYFANTPPLSGEGLSRRLLLGTQGADEWLKKQAAKNPSGLKQFANDRVHWALSKLGSWDVNGFPRANIPGLQQLFGDITMARAPMSVVFCWLYVVTFPFREYLAIRRQKPDDLTKETVDVAIRDMTSFALILFTLDPFVRWLNKYGLQKLAKLPLVHHGETMAYSQMEKAYVIRTPQQLMSLAGNEQTRRGLAQAVKELGDRGLGQHGFTDLQTAVDQFKQRMSEVMANPKSLPHAEQAFKTLSVLDDLVARAGKSAFAGKPGDKASALVKAADKVRNNYKYNQFLSYYANRFRVPADLASLAAVVCLAGWLPLALNNIFSLRAIERYKKNHQRPKAGDKPYTGLVKSNTNLAFAAFTPQPHNG